MKNLFLDGSKLLYHLPAVQKWLKGEEVFPVHVEISPSSGCNQRCILCCVDFKGHKPKNIEEKILLNLVRDFKKCGVKSFLLAGEGEPLLNKGIIKMLEVSQRLGVDAALNSNAVLLTEDVSRKILPALTWVRFTVQAANPALYAKIHSVPEWHFDHAIKNIRYAVELRRKKNLEVTLGIQQILINENCGQEVYNVAKLSKDLGVDYFVVKRFSKHPDNAYNCPEDLYLGSLEVFKKIENELQNEDFKTIVRWRQFAQECRRIYKKCIGLPFITQVLADAGVYPCCQYFSDKKMCYGNLHKKSFIQIWRSPRRKRIMKNIEQHVDVTKCMTYCRHHSTNQFLWQFLDRPEHINFI